MGRSLTNNFGLIYTTEDSNGVPDTVWRRLEPNSVGGFGATIATVARNPISPNRQRLKGAITDLDSAVDFEADLTISAFRDFAEGFVFSRSVNGIVTDLITTAAETTGDSYTVSALSASQADKFEIDTLIYVSGFTNSSNNGLKVVDADIATSATAISVAENLTDETAPANARLSFAGYQISAASTVTWDWDAVNKRATLTCIGKGTVLQALGLTRGQFVHIGSPDGSGGVQRAFQNLAANDMYGYARVVSMTADAVVFDKVDPALQFDDMTDPATAVDILFGEFIRNVSSTSAEYLEKRIQFEAEFVGLDTGGGNMYSYSKGNLCNTMGFNLPLTDKATISLAFIGTDTDNPVASGSRKSGASSALTPTNTSAFNTSSDIARLRITEVDEDGITTDFKSITLNINNNIGPEKVLGLLGAKYMNTGNFEVSVEAQLVFTNSQVINKIRANETVTMDFVIKNDNGAIAIDFPSMTLGGGNLELPVNQSILINTTGEAFRDATLDTSIGISIFPIVP